MFLTLGKVKRLLPLLLLILIGCSNISDEVLIDGIWNATAGYIDGKPKGSPDCRDFLYGGIEFRDDGTVYGKEFIEEFNYKLEGRGNRTTITFSRKNVPYSYYIDKISNDEFGLVGSDGYQEGESCYFERQ